jgi:hypothetical protein
MKSRKIIESRSRSSFQLCPQCSWWGYLALRNTVSLFLQSSIFDEILPFYSHDLYNHLKSCKLALCNCALRMLSFLQKQRTRRQNRSCLESGFQGGGSIWKVGRRVNMVEIFCIHVYRQKHETCWTQTGGRWEGVKDNDRDSEFSSDILWEIL